jgi:hypothetical protein
MARRTVYWLALTCFSPSPIITRAIAYYLYLLLSPFCRRLPCLSMHSSNLPGWQMQLLVTIFLNSGDLIKDHTPQLFNIPFASLITIWKVTSTECDSVANTQPSNADEGSKLITTYAKDKITNLFTKVTSPAKE